MSLQSNELNEGASASIPSAAQLQMVGIQALVSSAYFWTGRSWMRFREDVPVLRDDYIRQLMGGLFAQAIEAGTAKTAGLGPQGESAVPNGDAS